MNYKLLEDFKDGSAESIEIRIVALYYELQKENPYIGSKKHDWFLNTELISGLKSGFITAERIYHYFVCTLRWQTPGGKKSVARALNGLRAKKVIRAGSGIRLTRETIEKLRSLESSQ